MEQRQQPARGMSGREGEERWTGSGAARRGSQIKRWKGACVRWDGSRGRKGGQAAGWRRGEGWRQEGSRHGLRGHGVVGGARAATGQGWWGVGGEDRGREDQGGEWGKRIMAAGVHRRGEPKEEGRRMHPSIYVLTAVKTEGDRPPRWPCPMPSQEEAAAAPAALALLDI